MVFDHNCLSSAEMVLRSDYYCDVSPKPLWLNLMSRFRILKSSLSVYPLKEMILPSSTTKDRGGVLLETVAQQGLSCMICTNLFLHVGVETPKYSGRDFSFWRKG